MFDFSNYSTKSKYYDNSSKLVFGKMNDETGGVVIGEFVDGKSQMYSFVEDINEHKKAKDVNKNVFATVDRNEYKDILLNNKCIRHPMSRIQNKDHRTETYLLWKTIVLITIQKRFFVKQRVLFFSLIKREQLFCQSIKV